jgi:hypothetical protein
MLRQLSVMVAMLVMGGRSVIKYVILQDEMNVNRYLE